MTKRILLLLIHSFVLITAGFSFFGKESNHEQLYENMNPNDVYDYGVDTSFPIHHRTKAGTHFGNRYRSLMKGCYDTFSQRECDVNEDARIEMNLQQPKNQYNYTEIGFKKLKVPENIWKIIQEFWEENKHKEKLEKWPRGNTYVNNWESPTYMVSFEDKSLRGGIAMKDQIWTAMKPIISEWTGKELVATSLYGIRVYKDKAVLATHVDRLPLVSSAIIQVAQNINEPWPVEVYSHDGKAYNVTMSPGEMVLYESHTVLHGRPFPLNGTFYANIFVHFAPIDHDENNKLVHPGRRITPEQNKIMHSNRLNPKGNNIGGHEQSQHDDIDLKRHFDRHDREQLEKSKQKTVAEDEKEEEEVEVAEGEEEEEEEVEQEEQEEEEGEEENDIKDSRHSRNREPRDGRSDLHVAAADGDLDAIEKILKNSHSDLINIKDANEWQAIHEAARGGHLETVKYLVDMGADIGSKTKNGGTVLWWAKRLLDEEHPVIEYLESIGAPEEGEEL